VIRPQKNNVRTIEIPPSKKGKYRLPVNDAGVHPRIDLSFSKNKNARTGTGAGV